MNKFDSLLLTVIVGMVVIGCEKSDKRPAFHSVESVSRVLLRKFHRTNLYYNYQDTVLVTGHSKTYTFTIPKGTTMEKLGRAAYRDLTLYERWGLRGVKILYELSCDLNGYTNANQIEAGASMTFYSVYALGLEAVDIEGNTLPGYMIKDTISFLKGIVLNDESGQFTNKVRLKLRNKTGRQIPIVFDRDIFETVNVRVNPQNFVVAEKKEINIRAYSTISVILDMFCINQDKAGAVGEKVAPTLLIMRRSFDCQRDVWKYLQSLKY